MNMNSIQRIANGCSGRIDSYNMFNNFELNHLLNFILSSSSKTIDQRWIKKLSKLERTLMCWWIFTGLTHIVLDCYFVFSPEFYKDKTHFFITEFWKEYSKGDSRFAARDSAVVSIEGITAFLVGPSSCLIMYGIAAKKSYRYTLQLVISVAQLYGTLLYFLTAVLDGDNFAASPFYYYYYYVLASLFWILIPTVISIYCWKKINIAINDQEVSKLMKVHLL